MDLDDESEDADYDKQRYFKDCGISEPPISDSQAPKTEIQPQANGLPPTANGQLPTIKGQPPADERPSVYDLEQRFDAYGQAIYIESAFHHDGKPIVWYRIDGKTNELVRHERKTFGIFITRVGPAPYLPRQ
jgi:hypothetical protein